MIPFIRRRLARQLAVISSVGALLFVAIPGYLSFRLAKGDLQNGEFAKLTVIRDSKQREIVSWFSEVTDDLSFLAASMRVRAALEDLSKSDADPDQVKWATSGLSEFLQTFLKLNPAEEGFEDFLLLGAKSGRVLYSQKKSGDYSSDAESGKVKDSGIAAVWKLVSSSKRPAVADFQVYQDSPSATGFVGAPVFHHYSSEFIGVLVARVNTNVVNRILTVSVSTDGVDQLYLVGEDLKFRSRPVSMGDAVKVVQEVESDTVRQALEGQIVRGEGTSIAGRAALVVAGPVGMKAQKAFQASFDWVLVAEMDRNDALRGVRNLGRALTGLALATIVLAVGAAIVISRWITGPLVTLEDKALAVSKGDLTADVPKTTRTDEIGSLLQAFAAMTQNLRDQIGQVAAGVKVIRSSTGQITSIISQVASSTSNTSSAVTETMTTVEQVRQTAQIVLDRAHDVAIASRESAERSKGGATATEDAIKKISVIERTMDSVSRTVEELSQHSRAIEEIINVVKDLADQSHLLAVNASIEAARSGEHGKGFTVVAAQIKSLADQSKAATDQVRSILEETKRRIEALVLAAEQGGTAVHAGVELSELTAAAIRDLSGAVEASAQLAGTIETSIEQQFSGVEQVHIAMASIDKTIQQNSDGITRLEEAARRLEELGEILKSLVDKYQA